MSNFTFGAFTTELKQVSEEEEEIGVTFEDKALTWDNAADVAEVVAALENNKLVHFLKLEGNTLGVNAAAAIGKALERHPEFRKALWRNMFTRRLKTEIPQALKLLGGGLMVAGAQLAVLDLSDNALGPNGMVGLEELLRSPVCYTLQELRLNNCGLGIGGGQMLSKALLDCHRTSTEAGTPLRLKVFITGRNRLENDGAKAIAKIFFTLKTLEEIAMPQNSIYHEGIAALAAGLRENPHLRVLNLNDNTVTAKGAASLAEAFSFTHNLREINFGDCLLKTNGAYHFAEALEEHRNLEVVDLSSNEIKSNGGLVLVGALQNKPHLKELNLDGNLFGYDGRERIKDEMSQACNPAALQEFEEDQSEDENDEDEAEEDDDDDVDAEDEDELYDDEHHNDTTEEVDEDDEDYQQQYAYEADVTAEVDATADADATGEAYTTTQGYTTKLLNANESLNSYKSVSFAADSTTTAATAASSYKSMTAELFCLSQQPCTLQMFEAISGDNKLEAFKAVINQFTEDNYLLLLIFTTLKCAHLAQSSSVALELAMALYKESFDYAVRTQQERRVLNYYLIQLGLLRSEQKFKSAYNLESCRFALRETLYKQQIASAHIKNACEVFLNNQQ